MRRFCQRVRFWFPEVLLTVVLAWGLLLAFCASGCAYPDPTEPGAVIGRTVPEQKAATVQINVRCHLTRIDPEEPLPVVKWRGSGVLVTDATVATAAHVVDCPGSASFAVIASDGRLAIGSVDRWSRWDLALLRIWPELEAAPVTIAPKPLVGDPVCISSARPKRYHRCGKAGRSRDVPGDLRVSTPIYPGNSGSGVYDATGRLVGVATNSERKGDRYIAGWVATLQERPWVIGR